MPLKSRTIRRLKKNLHKNQVLKTNNPLRMALVCRTKVRVFETQAEAQVELTRLIADEGYDPSTRAFACSHCSHWHIGRLVAKEKRAS